MAGMQKRVPARLVMVGDGPDRPRASRRAEELGVADHVVFLGKHQAVAELLSCADLLLLPSETESFGLTALEAMACGAPVIATNAGGLPEVVEDGVSGRLFDVGDVSGMAAAGVELLADETLRSRFAEAGRRIARERFSAEAVVPRYEAVYQRVMSG